MEKEISPFNGPVTSGKAVEAVPHNCQTSGGPLQVLRKPRNEERSRYQPLNPSMLLLPSQRPREGEPKLGLKKRKQNQSSQVHSRKPSLGIHRKPGNRFGLHLDGAAPSTFIETQSIDQYQEVVKCTKAGSSNPMSQKDGLLVHKRRCSQSLMFTPSDHNESHLQQAKLAGTELPAHIEDEDGSGTESENESRGRGEGDGDLSQGDDAPAPAPKRRTRTVKQNIDDPMLSSFYPRLCQAVLDYVKAKGLFHLQQVTHDPFPNANQAKTGICRELLGEAMMHFRDQRCNLEDGYLPGPKMIW
ncbi:hypothetical protein PAXINDRAFT_157022 [Paxillus involutus ATCC 200175]|uniref:Uncharacterized protein n=1 Tax=Paxillus involutus ATCC 200175 TaxID=664439 RepID=A0A0C9TX87_PAXIN|nr:hypothetical protein PAXINDRAFT_157022 [Paxillus involutus ATCC 200175]